MDQPKASDPLVSVLASFARVQPPSERGQPERSAAVQECLRSPRNRQRSIGKTRWGNPSRVRQLGVEVPKLALGQRLPDLP